MYDFNKIEEKWQKYWEENKTFKTDTLDFSKPKFYALDMFPYPSGDGLHVGHPEGYTATDIISRMKRMQGYNVLHPIGFDSFGLPAEQYAINTGNHPENFTQKNIKTFTKQLKMLGFSYDWDRQVSTCDPKFYKWTQWIFKQLYLDGLARYIDMPVNWCEELGTVLANDEIIDGKSERGGYPVVQKNMKQWVIDIPKYAEHLLEGLESIDWPSSTKEIQKNWIGKSIGAEVDFKVADTNYKFRIFTTRPDTLFGATYCVLSPEHELVNKITSEKQRKSVEEYQKLCATKSELERTELNNEKTGVFTGASAINPVNGEKIPIWIADYVLSSYGTGAIMAVPAHDERDYDFAKKFNIHITQVIAPYFPADSGNELNPDVKTDVRESIVVALKHHEKDEYICLNWRMKDWKSFIVGGIEEDETVGEAAIREVREETGYQNIEIEKIFEFEHHSSFYATHKNVNRYLIAKPVIVKLKDDFQKEITEEEKAKHEFVWVKTEDLIKYVNLSNHKYVAELVINKEGSYDGDGIMINSQFLNGLNSEEAINKIISWLEEKGLGSKKVNYRLREWIFARQRYWGEPIPIIHFEDGTKKILEDSELPLVLPNLEDYSPSKTGASPLDKATDWVNVTVNGKKGKRETSTMPGSAGSSWYFLRYIDPNNDKKLADKKLLEHWLPVDLYVGGPEHSVGHLLYSRFWNNFLYDKGYVSVKEPFKKLRHQGMILGSNGEKMSKSRGNVVNPDAIINKYGSDTLRLYEMFMGPLEASKPWDANMIEGSKRFLDRIWRLYIEEDKIKDINNINLEKIYHKTVKKVTEDYEKMNFNTAISQMMIFINAVYVEEVFPEEYAKGFIKLLNPIVPHITEEIWQVVFNNTNTISYESWPSYEETKTIDEKYEMIVQVNGKVRGRVLVPMEANKEEMETLAQAIDNVKKYIEGKEIIKIITVPQKLVNIVVRG